MKKLILTATFVFGLLPRITNAQTIDTVVNVGNGHQLHFTIIKGKGTPILFEAGLGDGASIWNSITKQIADATAATVITYDRLSYGDNLKNCLIGLENEIKALETGLQKLGFANKNIMLVSHSLGGMYNQYYASRHSTEIKATILIDDANVCSLTSWFKTANTEQNDTIKKYLADILETVSKNPIPQNIPITDIVAEHQYDDNGNVDTVNEKIWIDCHKNFVTQSPQRKILIAYGTGHHIFIDNPPLAINAIITQYANYAEPKQKTIIIERAYKLELAIVNDNKKNEVKCGQKEGDLNAWAYSLLEKNELEKAIEVFKLNVTLNPNSWNAYDSLAEAYLKKGNKELAKKNYKKSLELNPKNDNATKVLEQIK
ncbi:MAG: tetratricopeptide repeat protein [Bacteroidetes bacterium]|nr:tetratricopeptide repeat protein [Bacteroidota bacterium]